MNGELSFALGSPQFEKVEGWVRGGPAGDLEGLNQSSTRQLPTHGQLSGGCVGAGDEGGVAKFQNTMLQGSREVKGQPQGRLLRAFPTAVI